MSKAIQPPLVSELKFTTHFLFCNCSLWPEMPDLLSYHQISDCLCQHQAAQCKLVFDFQVCCDFVNQGFCCDRTKLSPLNSCVLCSQAGECTNCCCCVGGSESACLFPKTLCKCAVQELCIDCRAALPPDQDVPIACSIFGKYFYGQPGSGWTSPVVNVQPSRHNMN